MFVSGFYAGDHDRAPEAQDGECAVLVMCAPFTPWKQVIDEMAREVMEAFDAHECAAALEAVCDWSANYPMNQAVAPGMKGCKAFCVAVYLAA